MTQPSFSLRHHNRIAFPTKHIVVAEDDIGHQHDFALHFSHLLEPQGDVQIDFVCSAIGAACILSNMKVNLIVLDHDLPYGNGSDLLHWMAANKRAPVITASGIHENNLHMESLGQELGLEVHRYQKQEVFMGAADHLIVEILKRDATVPRDRREARQATPAPPCSSAE